MSDDADDEHTKALRLAAAASAEDKPTEEEIQRILADAVEVPGHAAESGEARIAAEHREQLDTIRELSAKAQRKAAPVVRFDARDVPPPIETGSTAEARLHARVPASQVPGYWETIERNAETWAHELSGQAFWREAKAGSNAWSAEYFREHKSPLLTAPGLPVFSGKKQPRIREKTLAEIAATRRIDEILPPGAIIPALNDLVRVRIATQYLDGVGFVAQRLKGLLASNGISADLVPRALLTGYYAIHIYFTYPFLFRQAPSSEVNVRVKCEIQIATELATTIWDRTHGAYELARVAADSPREWMWNPSDPRFLATQLAHMIHLADGLTVQLRDAIAKKKRGDKP